LDAALYIETPRKNRGERMKKYDGRRLDAELYVYTNQDNYTSVLGQIVEISDVYVHILSNDDEKLSIIYPMHRIKEIHLYEVDEEVETHAE